MSKFRSDEVFSADPREQKLRRDVEASRMTGQAFLDSGISMRGVALVLSRPEKRIRQCADPSHPLTLSLSDLLGLPRELAVLILEKLCEVHMKRLADLPEGGPDGAARELAIEALQTSAGAVQAVLQSEDAAATKLDADEALKQVQEAIRSLERVAAKLMQARGNVRPIRNGDR